MPATIIDAQGEFLSKAAAVGSVRIDRKFWTNPDIHFLRFSPSYQRHRNGQD
jgi:hypothetical protein